MNTNQIALTQSTFDAITRTLASAREAVRCWENFGWSKESQDSIEAMRVCLYQLKDPASIHHSIVAAVDVTAAPAADAKQAPQSITITLRQAETLLRFFGGHDAEVIVTGPAPGQAAGLFAYCAECPDEGCEYLGVTEVDDELATNGRPAPAAASLLEEPLQRLDDLLFAAQRTTGVAQDKAINKARIVLYRLRAQPQAEAATLPIELHGVAQVAAGGGGCWRSCSGCHELNEGHATGPYSEVFECALGNGCDECGGTGAIWDTTDYGAMADHMARSLAALQAEPAEQTGHTDGGRNMFYKGRFDGETEREQRARLRWADDMRAAFERHTGNRWFDKDWYAETGIWTAAWTACLAAQPAPESNIAMQCIGHGDLHPNARRDYELLVDGESGSTAA